jgi:hypothetical protein
MAYWTSYAELGKEDQVQPWLLARMPEDMREEFLHALPEIRKRLAQIPSRITSGR